jgi:predicted nucleotidyltransferase
LIVLSSFENLVEGCFVTTSDNLIFEVKGVVHPQNRIIAYLRYVPNDEHENLGYRKVYNLKDREEYLTLKFPEYLWYSDVYGRTIQSVPMSKVVSSHRPVEYLDYMRNHTISLNRLQKSSIELVRELVDSTEISWSNIGITGSQLLGIATEKSDIDLVVYGSRTCRKFHSSLSKNYNKIPGIKSYSDETLKVHLAFRWGNLIQYHDILGEIESRKVLQGLFNEHEFFIRLVKLPHEVDEVYGKVMYRLMDSCKCRCTISDDNDSIFTPCVYNVESFDHPQLRRIVSYRGRFTEQAKTGSVVEARGRLECVTDIATGEEFQQLVLGEDPTDFLLPV